MILSLALWLLVSLATVSAGIVAVKMVRRGRRTPKAEEKARHNEAGAGEAGSRENAGPGEQHLRPQGEEPDVSLILRTATFYLLPLLLLFSVFLLIRGHHEPGGGFIAGLVAAASVILCALAYDVQQARRIVHLDPHTLVAIGLLTALGSGCGGWFKGEPFLTAAATKVTVPGLGEMSIGTALAFDFGIYLVVIGGTLLALLNLAEK